MIPQSFITDLLNRVDIVDVVGKYVQLKKGGANFMGLCPFHNEKSPSFTVSPTKQFYHCFGCGAHGSSIGFLMEYSGLSYVDAIRDLAQGNGMIVPEEDRLLPAQRAEVTAKSLALSDAEVAAAVAAAVAATGAAGPQDMRKVIDVLKPQLAGRADMGKVSGLVKAALAR